MLGPASLILFGVLLSGYLTAGMLFERAHTGLNIGLSLAHLPDPTLSQLIVWSNYRYFPARAELGHWYGGYLGLSLVVLGACSGFWWIRKRGRTVRTLPATVCLGVTFLFVFGYRLPIVRDLPGLQAFNAGRYLLFTVFFLCILVPSGISSLYVLARRHRPHALTALCLCLVGLDLGPTTFQQPYLKSETAQTLLPASFADQHQAGLDALPPGELPKYPPHPCVRTDRSICPCHLDDGQDGCAEYTGCVRRIATGHVGVCGPPSGEVCGCVGIRLYAQGFIPNGKWSGLPPECEHVLFRPGLRAGRGLCSAGPNPDAESNRCVQQKSHLGWREVRSCKPHA